ncbi:hypothetical protein K1T71_002483 [Dendrolimus kikuchii]|uniref:Uncharacterized protein n=1 Tax=Dendrolimus kikuchii TaxID=765133 RepID=A0ACC1DD58_9NEOP|nr:hypothetical protein K1T71_002483 [Dendrolimus kikuchii]
MFTLKIVNRKLISKSNIILRSYSSNKNPMSRTWNVIKKDIPVLFGKKKDILYPEHADIVIIGGGLIGASVAYWLKTRAGEGLSIVVLEKDFTYKDYQKLGQYNQGNLKQHYSLPENLHLAQNSSEFLRNINKNLGSDVVIDYRPTGSLVLASEKYAEKLEHNVKLQNEFGFKNKLLTPETIRNKFPWINTDDIKLGCTCIESEGTYDIWELHKGLIKKSKELGATYVNAEVIGFEVEQQRDVLMEGVAPGSFKKIMRVIYQTPDKEQYTVKFAGCILAAGDKSPEVAKLAHIGTGDGLLSVSLPIQRQENKIYSIKQKTILPGLTTPSVMDTSGLWLRRNGLENNLLCGHIPIPSLKSKDMVEEEYFSSIIKPALVNRVPSCEDAEINIVGTEVYDYNTYDETGILGPHPYHNNLYIAAGFGKEGCQHAPGIGRAIAELIIDSQFVNIDLTRFGFDRFLIGEPMIESNIY